MTYQEFLAQKIHLATSGGFSPEALPDWLFPFQRALTAWSLETGRAAIFADCGLGKTPMQLVWADAIVRRTNRPVLVVAPLSASAQTVREAEKFRTWIESRFRDGEMSRDTRDRPQDRFLRWLRKCKPGDEDDRRAASDG